MCIRDRYVVLCEKLAQIKKNSLWELLSNFTVVSDVINPIKVRKEKSNESAGLNTYKSPFWNLRNYQEQMHTLYVLHDSLESNIIDLLYSMNDPNFEDKHSKLLNEFANFITKVKDTLQFLEELARSFYAILNSPLDSNSDLLKLPACTSIMELAIGARFSSNESIPLSVLACKVFYKKSIMVIDKISVAKLIRVLIEKQSCLKKAIDYFQRLNNFITMISRDGSSLEICSQIRSMVPLKALSILLKKMD
eukprot:TRINITY_DN13708_c0_g2_i2.p1 TRINITY_DN13708_c0_g2~~TRINITY_DN13708_c0_g2_i2.p1  ORF type:complete len:250 (+),score=32.32 TRINITY_DN13708_c0_g2_i2:74-823(+)